ncbi:MAG TPA: glutamate--tRNA ligase [Turneriella sp.]|nr:glutamate--tRNA ligase [Turneriella sp.]
MKEVRTRFAPSPTGYLHVGGARTALFNYLYARAQKGKFILRIEDTDQARSTEQSYHQVLDSLKWLGLEWDEGPEVGGVHGPYRQSERLHLYKEYAEKLVHEKKAYPCFCTTDELDRKKKQREAMGLPYVYDGKCRNLTDAEIHEKKAAGVEHTIRFRTPAKEVVVDDMVQGSVRFDTALIGDFIIVKSDGFASYNYAVVVDDHLMDITHVIRGVGHLSNTPRQIMIYNALGWQDPQWAHVSEIVGSDHKKLSKRHGATPITAFRDLGYTARAFNNYMALLGWSSPDGREYMTIDEQKSLFDVARCSKSPAMFDVFDLTKAAEVDLAQVPIQELEGYLFQKSKLNWLSNQHIRATEDNTYIHEVFPFVQKANVVPQAELNESNERLRGILLSLRVYLDTLGQIKNYLPDFYLPFTPSATAYSASEYFLDEKFVLLSSTFLRLIEEMDGGENNDTLEENRIKEAIQQVGKELTIKGKPLFMGLRLASTGRLEGLELPVYLSLLGKARVVERLKKMISVKTA